MDVRLEWLEIRKFRNVKRCRLAFNGGHNVLLGLNATGKTTLLNLVAMVLNGSFEDIRDEEFDISFAATYAGTRLEGSVQNERTQASRHKFWDSTSQLGANRPGVKWSMDIQPPAPASRHYRQWPQGSSAQGPQTDSLAPDLPFRYPNWLTWVVLPKLIATGRAHLDGASSELRSLVPMPCQRLDESVEYFQSLRFTPDSPPLTRNWGPLQIASWPSVMLTSSGPWWGSVPEELRNSQAAKPLGEDDLILDPGNRSHLTSTAASLLGVAQVALRLHYISADRDEPLYGGVKFFFRAGSTTFSEDRLSYGQKRLLGFLYYAACANVIVADELVNGLHHSWIDACVKEIGDRQSFLTSQNALLLDHLELKRPEEAQRMFIVCKKDEGQLSWENITMEQAKDIFEAREVGIQQLSEILLARGLW